MSIPSRHSTDDAVSFYLKAAFYAALGMVGLWRAWEGSRHGSLLVFHARSGGAHVAHAAGPTAGSFWFELILMGGIGVFFTAAFCAIVWVRCFGSPDRQASLRQWLTTDDEAFWRVPGWVLILVAVAVAFFFKHIARA